MICPECKIRKKQKHANSKYCKPCALKLRRSPRGKLSKKQIELVKKYAGTMFVHEMAEKVGTSKSNLVRWNRQVGRLNLNALAYPENVIEKVTSYYEKHGKRKTQEKFPDVNVRSIVERYKKFKPRNSRWTDNQIKELVQMAGLISMKAQAKYFDRPMANAGSIRSAWRKKFGMGAGYINGMPWHRAKYFIDSKCPSIERRFWAQRRENRGKKQKVRRVVFLWVDMEKHLRDDCPEFIANGIHAMADFQRWVFGVKDVRAKVRRIVEMRELARG